MVTVKIKSALGYTFGSSIVGHYVNGRVNHNNTVLEVTSGEIIRVLSQDMDYFLGFKSVGSTSRIWSFSKDFGDDWEIVEDEPLYALVAFGGTPLKNYAYKCWITNLEIGNPVLVEIRGGTSYGVAYFHQYVEPTEVATGWIVEDLHMHLNDEKSRRPRTWSDRSEL